MKNLPVMAIAIALSFVFTACNSSNSTKKMDSQQKSAIDSGASSLATATYTCSMHPEISSNKPGQCSECGMDLVKNTSLQDSAGAARDSIKHLNKTN